jgi:RNA polymerase sigma factor (sigma-70 family)
LTGRLATAARQRPAPAADAALAVAACAGDRAALDTLVRRHLPMVYNLVRQALGAHPDVDDVVQDVALRALRQLRDLRKPESFRPWLAAITVRQIGTHLSRADLAASRTTALDDEAWRPAAGAGPEDSALLRAELAGQRRQVRHAGRWLSPDERTLLSLWWLETVGELSRAEVATALGLNIAHAGVRLQRMREQLDLSRTIVAALETVPGCRDLADVVADWNGVPSPFWRKRIARHTRTCPTCERATDAMIPTERLLAGVALLPVPALVSGAATTTVTTGTIPSMLARIVQATAARRWATTTVAGAAALALGLATTATDPATAPPTAPAVAAPPSAAAITPLRTGRLSLESANARGRFVAIGGTVGVLGTTTDRAARRRATLEAVPGLTDPACFTFRTANGRHLRHASWRLRASAEQKTSLERGDATFCVRDGEIAGSVALESANFPGYFLRHIGLELWVDQYEHTAAFRADSSFLVHPPLI